MNVNNVIENFSSQASQGVIEAIYNASDKSGVDFSYLMQQAKAESSFDADASASTSSAQGLYQFIDSTWLSMVQKHGREYGIDTDTLSKQDILDLRNDPDIASHMAAELALENKHALDNFWGGEVGSTELYFAHFMGAGGAASFLKAKDDNPLQEAALLFPKAARANENVFYDLSTGRAKSLAEVYHFFDQKFQLHIDEPSADNAAAYASSNNTSTNSNTTSPSAFANHHSIDAQSNMFAALFSNTNPAKPIYTAGSPSKSAAPSFYKNNSLFNLVQDPVELMILSSLGDDIFDLKDARKNG